MIIRKYEATLAPTGKFTDVLPEKGGHVCERFDHYTFAGNVRNPDRIPVVLDHLEQRRIGHLVRLEPRDGWWRCRFRLDQDSLYADFAEKLRVLREGQPVSIKFTKVRCRDVHDTGLLSHELAALEHVALVVAGAYAGAEIVAVRRADEPAPDMPVTLDPTLVARPEAAGVPIPAALKRTKPKPAPVPASAIERRVHYRPGLGEVLHVR